MKENNKRIDELARKIKKGDKNAFEELYKLTSSKAYFVALQICNDKQEAEDILQESYITALNKISTLERTESFMSWFNRIVINKSKDFLKKKNPKLLSEDDEWLLETLTDESEKFSPESNVDKDELRNVVMDAVQELTVEKRTCVMMKYFNDMSVDEIAKTMEVPVSTVKNRLFNARKELKSLFEKKGITAAYSVAPFGVVGWAYEAAFENIKQTFENSASATKIFSGIAIAATSAATASSAAAGTAATGGGLVAKSAVATTIQKVVSGLVVAGVVTGSTVGITTVIKNKIDDNLPTTVNTETIDYAEMPEPETLPVINEIAVDPDSDEIDEYGNKTLDFNTPGTMIQKVRYKGTMKYGKNHIEFEDDIEVYYVNFNAEKAGYYSIICDYKDPFTHCSVVLPEDPYSNTISGFSDYEINMMNGISVNYLNKGENTVLVFRDEGYDSTDIDVEYLGEELTDIVIDQDELDNVVLGYNEFIGYDESLGMNMWLNQDQYRYKEGTYANIFKTKLVFSSGKTYDVGEKQFMYTIKEGKLKEGKNTMVITFFDKEFEKEITVRPITDFVKDIEISNLEEISVAEIGEDGFVFEKPEEYDITVTYADGSKETFDGKTWDRFLEFDSGVKLRVLMFTSELRGREALKFVVAIGEHRFVESLCVIKEFDVIGYRKALDRNNLETAKEYYEEIERDYEMAKYDVDNVEDLFRYSSELAIKTVYYSFKVVKRIAGFELDYFITTFKILTENEFDLLN